MASRFFMSDSESDSDSDFEKETPKFPVGGAFTFSDDDDDGKRVVLSVKEKRNLALDKILTSIKSNLKKRDIYNLLNKFEELTKTYQRTPAFYGVFKDSSTPRILVKCVAEVEDFVNDLWINKEDKDDLTKNQQRYLGTLRQKIRKSARDFEKELKEYRQNPDASSEDDDDHKEPRKADEDKQDDDVESSESEKEEEDEPEADDDESEDDDFDLDLIKRPSKSLSAPVKQPMFTKEKPAKPAAPKLMDELDLGGSGSDDSMMWPSDSETDDDDDDEKGFKKTRDNFLKKKEDDDDEMGRRGKRRKERKRGEGEDDDKDKSRRRKGDKKEDLTRPVVYKRVTDILMGRANKVDKRTIISYLSRVISLAEEVNLGEGLIVKLHYALILNMLNFKQTPFEPLLPKVFTSSLTKVHQLVDMLKTLDGVVTFSPFVSEDKEEVEKKPYSINGSIMSVVEMLDEEYVKLLKSCDSHSNEYVQRLQDEVQICEIINKVVELEERKSDTNGRCRAYLLKVEHIYYKYDKTISDIEAKNSLDLVDKLCSYIYSEDQTDRLRTRAALCQIYHLAINDKWYEARDFMLMTHLQESISQADLRTQILYNRALVQLGLCGFRHGQIKDAHNALLDIQSGGRAKELLAQGLLPQRQTDRTAKQETIEKTRHLPFHQHINLEVVECVYLVSAMLIEIPYMAAHESDMRRRMISKSFHHQLKNAERQALVMPPDSMREHVVAAAKAMRVGQWKDCRNLILNEKMNGKVWKLFRNSDSVCSMLERKIKEETLRTYLFTYANVYDSISLGVLQDMFELSKSAVLSVISKMIISESIMASMDEPSACLVMHRVEPTPLQTLSLQLADKLYSMVENNERTLDQKPFYGRGGGNFRDRGDRGDRGDRQKNDGDRRMRD